MRQFLFLAFLGLSFFLTAQQADSWRAYTDFLESEIAEGQIAGAVSLVVRNGKTLHKGAWGKSDIATGAPMTEDRVFHIMSMTKPIVSVAAMQLWEQGKFQLDDPVSKYLDGFDGLRVATDVRQGKDQETVPAASPVTIRQVFSHTAGFSHGLSGSALDNDVARALYFAPQADIASRVKTLTELPLIGQPGKQWSYSASPDVLALLVEKLSGMTMDDYLRKNVFKPLRMNDTGYNMTEEQAARMPKLYKIVDGKLQQDKMQMPANGHSVFGGSHGLLSTVADYSRFCQMLLNGGKLKGKRILKASTIELMGESHIGDAPYAPGQTFGLGFGVTTATPEDDLDSKGRMFWSGAYSTFFFVDPANDLYAILMTQTSPYTGKYGEAMRKYVYEGMK